MWARVAAQRLKILDNTPHILAHQCWDPTVWKAKITTTPPPQTPPPQKQTNKQTNNNNNNKQTNQKSPDNVFRWSRDLDMYHLFLTNFTASRQFECPWIWFEVTGARESKNFCGKIVYNGVRANSVLFWAVTFHCRRYRDAWCND